MNRACSPPLIPALPLSFPHSYSLTISLILFSLLSPSPPLSLFLILLSCALSILSPLVCSLSLSYRVQVYDARVGMKLEFSFCASQLTRHTSVVLFCSARLALSRHISSSSSQLDPDSNIRVPHQILPHAPPLSTSQPLPIYLCAFRIPASPM